MKIIKQLFSSKDLEIDLHEKLKHKTYGAPRQSGVSTEKP
jgi:hypothetical protein